MSSEQKPKEAGCHPPHMKTGLDGAILEAGMVPSPDTSSGALTLNFRQHLLLAIAIEFKLPKYQVHQPKWTLTFCEMFLNIITPVKKLISQVGKQPAASR